MEKKKHRKTLRIDICLKKKSLDFYTEALQQMQFETKASAATWWLIISLNLSCF